MVTSAGPWPETSGSEIPEGTVTVLFTDLVESTRLNQQLGDDRARDISRQVEEMARESIRGHHGVLIKEMGDGLMAAFASARRAVAASREIQSEMRRLHRGGLDRSVEMRIGLHTGEVIAEDGDLHGETVIIAKRIEGLAPPGGILASDTVRGVLGTAREELVDQGVAQLKGIDDEWRLHLVPVLDDDDRTGLDDQEPTPFVGRIGEREQLRTMVESAAAGRGGMVLVSGAAGLGKSRLVHEAAAVANRLGVSVLTGNCLDMESPPPYQPHIDQLEQAARATTPERLRAALGENAPEVAKLMPSLRQRYDDIPPSPDLTPEQERRYMLHGVGEFIERAAANQPRMLVFEDLHWADESTLLLLRHLGPRLADFPVLVVGTYRADELEPGRPFAAALGPLTREIGAVQVRLDPLTRDEVESVLASRSGQAPPPELVDLVVEETQGNPFFVEELFGHLRDAGKLFSEDGGWRSGFEIGETEVPQGVRLLIGRRLDRLATEHRKILSTAAVIGRNFSFELLAASASAEEDDLFDALEAAERLHLIGEETSTGQARYSFVHEQIRQTLLGELSIARRQRLHRRTADALEGGSGESNAVEIAHHLQLSGDATPPDRTAAALMTAAESTLESLAFEDALRHLDRAALLVSTEQRPQLCSSRARALRGAGRVDDALVVLDLELAAGHGGIDDARLRLQRVQLLLDQYRAAEALDDVETLMVQAGDGAIPELELDVYLARGRAHYILSLDDPEHVHRSREAYEQAYVAAEQNGDKRKMALALLPTTWFTDYWADYRETAAANVAEALRLAEELDDEDLELDARSASMHRVGLARSAEASEELLARLEARRDPVRLNAHCFWMMWQYLAAARFEDCVATCDRGIELAGIIGSEPVQYGSIKAVALTEMGRFDEVAAAIDQEVTDEAHPFGQAMAALARAVFLTRVAAWRPAADALVDTIDRAASLSRVWMQAWAASLLAQVSAHLRDEPDLATDLDLAPLLERIAAFGPWTKHLTGGEIALIEGRPADALLAVSSRLSPGDTGERDRVQALDVAARSHLALGDFESAVEVATEGAAAAETTGFGSLGWRFLQVRATAASAPGQDEQAERDRVAATEAFQILSRRLEDGELRGWFERQALAPGRTPRR